jgi:hypothetical protein
MIRILIIVPVHKFGVRCTAVTAVTLVGIERMIAEFTRRKLADCRRLVPFFFFTVGYVLLYR